MGSWTTRAPISPGGTCRALWSTTWTFQPGAGFVRLCETRVNGEVVHYRDLADGDEVQFARARCRFNILGPDPDERPSD